MVQSHAESEFDSIEANSLICERYSAVACSYSQ